MVRTDAAALDNERQKWDDYYASLPMLEIDDAMRGFGKDLAQRMHELLPSGGRVLEAGCGGGWQSLVLAQSGKFEVTLMDFSSEALRHARQTFDQSGLSADFVCQDVISPGSLNMIWCSTPASWSITPSTSRSIPPRDGQPKPKVRDGLVPNRMCYWYWLWRTHQSGRGGWAYGKKCR